ncbi:MAG: hypothetical protein HY236_08750, partial [Acidobacteria bacterium]|nr:hypothetical protein [Acidobacteriota bacterium]
MEAGGRILLARFDAGGGVCWMNRAAREVWGAGKRVAEVLACGRPVPGLTSFPLSSYWLLVGREGGDSGAVRRRKLGQVNLVLLEMCSRRGWRNLGLARAGVRLETHHRHADRERLQGRDARELIAALEAERGRIARDLHDNAGQTLAGILLNLELVARHLGSAQTEVLARLRRSKELAQLAMEQIRKVSHELHPPQWDEVDFATAAEWLIDRMGLRPTMEVETAEMRPPKDLPLAVKTVLYRTLQE